MNSLFVIGSNQIKGLVIICIMLITASCVYDKHEKHEREIDFKVIGTDRNREMESDSTKAIMKVAIAAIISPQESFKYYEKLLEYLGAKTGKQIEMKQRQTYEEVNHLLENQMVDIAFICSGAYVTNNLDKKVELLAVPVCNGKPFYQAYIIVNEDSPVFSFGDLKGKSFAFTDPLSNSGKAYAVKLLEDLGYTTEDFFAKTIYTYAHDHSIQLVKKNLIEGATIDGLIYEYLLKLEPERVDNIRIIHKSEDFGIPPVVVPVGMPDKDVKQLQSVLFSMHSDPDGKAILDKLLIDKFIKGDIKNYQSIRKMKESSIQ